MFCPTVVKRNLMLTVIARVRDNIHIPSVVIMETVQILEIRMRKWAQGHYALKD